MGGGVWGGGVRGGPRIRCDGPDSKQYQNMMPLSIGPPSGLGCVVSTRTSSSLNPRPREYYLFICLLHGSYGISQIVFNGSSQP